MSVFDVKQGSSPVILGFPHTGTDVPSAIWDRLNDNGRMLADTDWHIHHLYDGLLPDVTTVRATFHRYVIDANRDPEGASLYPGQNTTGLVPDTDFDGAAIWKYGEEPTEADIAARRVAFHAPYHAALAAEIERVKAIHGVAVLYDCHSIRSHIPFLFDGRLPDFNIGTDMGMTCDPAIEAATFDVATKAGGYTSILNGRFKGGWTTRHYGRPEAGVHAIQMELAQVTHLKAEMPPFDYDEAKADKLRIHLKEILTRIEACALTFSKQARGTR
ncbi:N-formylglutamate deformylase [Agrobacterium rosae]|uniref:N-formylglutamate deformylase n=2 Tax=Pseudomonadota TaxID=1224 RepID=A0AAE5RW44_9HYPH|nr:N-formylglutamate deformylase [Agrobacterium rosae]KAA3515741.1 N-formylglutamate deformylase [Agrobacterium rosae]KAA3524701.1 N-formylglutamate deformylase [Agrobacterium rosae]MBN7803960.1 N-formylglutamate deformylase [Agrobacterium rosae]MCM2431648.1 N-formylglutamate deformylase [Agrobacterium rosae]MDX8312354.1 N-formylglutamate deformylase [Agrobacterium rosae]